MFWAGTNLFYWVGKGVLLTLNEQELLILAGGEVYKFD